MAESELAESQFRSRTLAQVHSAPDHSATRSNHPPESAVGSVKPARLFFEFGLFLSACSFFIYLTIICIFCQIRPFKEFGHSRYSDILPIEVFDQLEFNHFLFSQLEFGHNHYYQSYLNFYSLLFWWRLLWDTPRGLLLKTKFQVLINPI